MQYMITSVDLTEKERLALLQLSVSDAIAQLCEWAEAEAAPSPQQLYAVGEGLERWLGG